MWARNRRLWFIIIPVLLVGAGFGCARLWLAPGHDTMERHLTADGRTYTLEVAADDVSRAKGLGDRAAMAADRGMLFTFPDSDEQCFWMKDMHFSLDIIWLDANKHVLHVEPSLAPSSYPRTYCVQHTRYAIELVAGQAAAAGIRDGAVLKF